MTGPARHASVILKENGQDMVVAFGPRRAGSNMENDRLWLQSLRLVMFLCHHRVWQEATWMESPLWLSLVL